MSSNEPEDSTRTKPWLEIKLTTFNITFALVTVAVLSGLAASLGKAEGLPASWFGALLSGTFYFMGILAFSVALAGLFTWLGKKFF